VPAATVQSGVVGELREKGVGNEMRRQLGFYMQFSMLVLLPMLILWQLEYGFNLIWMPTCLLIGVVLFIVGTRLRES
jgi:hypothetical protein